MRRLVVAAIAVLLFAACSSGSPARVKADGSATLPDAVQQSLVDRVRLHTSDARGPLGVQFTQTTLGVAEPVISQYIAAEFPPSAPVYALYVAGSFTFLDWADGPAPSCDGGQCLPGPSSIFYVIGPDGHVYEGGPGFGPVRDPYNSGSDRQTEPDWSTLGSPSSTTVDFGPFDTAQIDSSSSGASGQCPDPQWRLCSTYFTLGYDPASTAAANYKVEPAPSDLQPSTSADDILITFRNSDFGQHVGQPGVTTIARFGLLTANRAVQAPPNYELVPAAPIERQPAWLVIVSGIEMSSADFPGPACAGPCSPTTPTTFLGCIVTVLSDADTQPLTGVSVGGDCPTVQ